jgi:hypothetical protein
MKYFKISINNIKKRVVKNNKKLMLYIAYFQSSKKEKFNLY